MRLDLKDSRRRRMFALSQAWLSSLWASELHKSSSRLEHMLKLVLGLWICRSALNDKSFSMQPLLENLETKLNSEHSSGAFDPFHYDSKLLLLVHQLLLRHNCHAVAINPFVKLIASAI